MFSKIKPDAKKDITMPIRFFEKLLRSAKGDYIKVYLEGLYRCETGKRALDSDIAKNLMLSENEVAAAWSYWQSVGAVKITYTDGKRTITFLDLSEECDPHIRPKPTYTIEEITYRLKNSPDLQDVYILAERILNKPLSTNDMLVIYGIHDYFGLDLDVIPLLLSFCINNGKKTMRSIETVGKSWADKGIITCKQAEEYLVGFEQKNEKLREFKNAVLGGDKPLSVWEKRYAKSWLFEMNLSCELIAYAAELAKTVTGELSFAYMNKALRDWSEKGIKTVAEAKKYTGAFKSAPQGKKKTGFSNFDQPGFDYDELERRALGKK